MRRRTVILISIVVLALGWLLSSGSRGGIEYFSPDTLELTTRSEITILYGAYPIYRSSPIHVENELVTFLKDQGFVTPQISVDARRILVYHWNGAWRDGDGLLYDVLHRYREQVIEWCREDRERAQLYWSEGFRYLRSDSPTEMQIGEAILNHLWRAESIQELEAGIASIRRELMP